jgi:hypothetical protein
LPVAAGWGAMVYLAHAVRPVLNGYMSFLTAFFLIGVLGFIIETWAFHLRPAINKPKSGRIVLSALKNHQALLASLALGAALAFFYSAIWPSGRMEIWMNNGGDFYSWLFVSDYLMSGLSRESFEALPMLERYSYDAFGTYMILDLISVSRGQGLLAAAPSCAVTFLAWIASAALALLKRGFGLGTKTAFLLALSLGMVPLLNYVAMTGMFGQLTAMVLTLTALAELAPAEGRDKEKSSLAKRLFFPLFSLFLSYQAGYPLFAAIIISIGFLSVFLHTKGTFLPRAIFSAKKNVLPVLAATAASFVLMPGVAYHLANRLEEVYLQKAGWSLNFFSPWQFSGLPVFSPHAFVPEPEPGKNFWAVFFYLPLLAVVIFLLILQIKIFTKKDIKNNSNFKLDNIIQKRNNFIISTTIAFLLSLIIYLIIYILFGHIYKIWKWATYSALPLSFVPLALSALVLERLKKYSKMLKKLSYFIILTLIFILGFKFISMPSLPTIPPTYFEVYSAEPFLDQLRRVKDLAPSGTTVVVDMNDESRMFLPAFIFKETDKFKVKYIYGMYYFFSHQDYFSLIDQNSIVISDIEYKNIFRAENKNFSPTTLFLYTYDHLNAKGYATIKTRNSYFDWRTESNYIFSKIKIPETLVGKDLRFEVRLTPKEPERDDCQIVRLGLRDEIGEIAWSVHKQSQISIDLPPEASAGGLLQTVVLTGDGPGNPATETCKYIVNGLYLAKTEDASL